MSENENENVTQGNGTAGWGWEPVPQGGEYDSDATAFVKLPQDMLDALGTGEPLAAPGHGYVPPPMIVPLGSATTDPAATGTWTIPVQWPEAGTSDPASAPAQAHAPAPVGGPIPASIPIPASVAAAFAEPEPEPDPGATAEWRFPDEDAATGQWAVADSAGQPADFRQSALDADWSQAPATLPGGAPAPWANHPDFAALQQDQGTLPGTDEAAAASAAAAAGTAAAGRLLGGPGVGAPPRGPRVLGGPGVGTPLPEAGEPVRPAPHDIEATHGAAAMPVEGERPHPVAEAAERPAAADGLDLFGGSRAAAAAEPVASEPAPFEPVASEHVVPEPVPFEPAASEHVAAEHVPFEQAAEPVGSDGRGFAAFGHEPQAAPEAEVEAEAGPGPEAGPEAEGERAGAEPADTDGHGFTGADPAPAGIPTGPTPTGDTADTAVAPPTEDTAEGFPAGGPTYEEDAAAAEAVAHHEHPQASYVLRVNGADRPVTGAWIGESLLYVLRERLGLAGAKDGCSQGECGACAVKVDGRLVASCLVPAATAAGSEVRTVEGLATNGELSDVQQALCRSGAVQCGFCVPGMAMTIHDLLEGNHAPSELETRQALCGNLCRCSGYAGVVDAVREVVAEREATASAAASAAAEHAGQVPAQGFPEPRIPHQAQPGEGGIHHGGTV
ncbi:2Fe-2S iron-sulfur cluster-binding protein [Streptomyces sp. NBC_00190]|uniref:2Fe-2S iron-sulfur cluster-binding protein n=1 Tax=Streptomyces sp. NBC_00190 TaxID=2903634 RepID=UPI002E29981A|nr:2Fe-2S iron-sulfur cluster-binding protein [Streptomyces sp. NBC_00190]